MHIVNRTLNIMIMLSAVAVCVFAWRLHDRRLELRDRGDLLARKIHEAAVQADKNSPTTVADRLECRLDGDGGLGWRTHSENRNQTVRALEDFVDTIAQTRKQRDDLGLYIAAVARRLEVETVKSKDLNNPGSSNASLTLVSNALTDFLARDAALREELAKVYTLIRPEANANAASLKDIKDCKGASNEIFGAVEKLQLRLSRHQTAMTKLTQTIGKTYFPGVELDDIQELRPETVQSLIASAQTVNERLAERVLLREQVSDLTKKLLHSVGLLDISHDKIALQKTKIETLQEKIHNLEIQTVDGPDPKVNKTPKYDGRVVKVNYDYNYLIISYEKDKDQIHRGLMLTVARDREYICRAQVSKLYKRYAVAEIPENDGVGIVMEGDRVVLLD